MSLHFDQLRQADLNLLINFSVLAEERSITRAAERLLLSQPAMSRSLQRLRDLFGDELLLRGRSGYELTSKGQRIQAELELLLPRLNQLIQGQRFNPYHEDVLFRVMGTDYALKVLAREVFHQILDPKMKARIDFLAWNPGVYEYLDQGKVDLAFLANDGLIPSCLKTETLFLEKMVCVVDRSSFKRRTRLSLAAYLSHQHVVVSLVDKEQTLPDKQLAKMGLSRSFNLRVPYFGAAMDAVKGTDLVATIPSRFVASMNLDKDLAVLEAPKEFGQFEYLMCWHPRLTHDPANQWLVAQTRKVFADD